jgi:hypothetical protein
MKGFKTGLLALALCTLLVANASAQANLALRGIGLKMGVVNPEQVDATFGLGLMFDLGTIHPQWALESYAGWWSQGEEAYGMEAGVTDYSFGGTVKYLFETSNPTLQPFAGAGLGLHIYDMHAETAPVYFGGTLLYPGSSYNDTEVELGLDLGGGLRIDRGNQFAFMTDAWFTISDVSQFSLMIGGIYMFGR